MKKTLFYALGATLMLASCAGKTSSTESAQEGIVVQGTINGIKTDKLIMGPAVNQTYDYVIPADTVDIIDGKFELANDTLQPGVYGFYLFTEVPANNTIVYMYLDKGTQKLDFSLSPHNFIEVRGSGLASTEAYQAWADALYQASERAVVDSLDNLFYIARQNRDEAEMGRVKDATMDIYRKGEAQKSDLINAELQKDRKDAMGMYLYYTHVFVTAQHSTLDEINATRAHIESYDDNAKATHYYKYMLDTLADSEQSVVGAVCPEITGEDAEGNPMKLSDFRGQYVLVDFWSSGCTWCRAETPNILKTFNDFKDKGFTILAASLDVKKEDWIKAMNEDGIKWPSLLLNDEDRKTMTSKFNVKGIPLILLVDKDGKIVARDLRGEDIYNAVKEHVK